MMYVWVLYADGETMSFLVPRTMTMADFSLLAEKTDKRKIRSMQFRDSSKTSVAVRGAP